MSFQPLKRILPRAIREAGIESQVSAARVVTEAEAALMRLWGSERAAHIQVISYKDGMLRLNLKSPAAGYQLELTKIQLINEINRVFSERKVLGIKVKREGF